MLKGSVEIRYGDLFSVIKKDEFFDVILFNPPYLSTKPDERIGETGWFDIATDGGVDGLNPIREFLKEIGNHFSRNGNGYFVFSSLSNRKKLVRYLNEHKLQYNVVSSRLFNDEQIEVYRVNF